jgi:Tfp pilus assembly protein PilN
MRQQINLYQPIFREERKALSAGSVAIGLTLIVAGLTVVSIYGRHSVAELEASVQTLRDQANRQQEALAQASELQAAGAKPLDAETRLNQLSAKVSEREQALKVLQSGVAGQTTGFAARMEALARRHVPGLWLDGMKLSGTSTSMSLQGATANADIVPVYLRSLAADAALAGTRFDEFVIQRAEVAKSEPAAEPESGEAKRSGATPVAQRPTLRFSAGSTSLPAANTNVKDGAS